MAEYKLIPVREIDSPDNPSRAVIDEQHILDLAESIKQLGLLQPLIVVTVNGAAHGTCSPDANGKLLGDARPETTAGDGEVAASPSGNESLAVSPFKYEVLAGHCRLLALRHLRAEVAPCIVYTDPDVAKAAVTIHENCYRRDLTPAEEGVYYAELINKFDLTEDALCHMVRQKPQYIYDRLSLVTGDQAILRAVLDRQVSFSVAKELNRVEDESHRRYLLDMAIKGGVTAATARQWVAAAKPQSPSEVSVDAAQTDSGATGDLSAPAMSCALCGGHQDPHNLRIVYLHFYEIDAMIKILEQAGVNADGLQKVRG